MPRLVQVTGMTGCGKSTLVRGLIADRPRVIIVQPFSKNDYEAFQYTDPLKLARDLHQVKPARFRVSLPASSQEELVEIIRLAWAVAPVTLVLDETAPYLSPSDTPKEFRMACQLGRHAGRDERQELSMIAIGQRPVNLPPVFRSEVEHWYLFRLNARPDRQLLEYDMGLSREEAERAGNLPRFHYMRVDRFGGVQYGQTSA